MNPRGSERTLRSPKTMKITLQEKDILRCLITHVHPDETRDENSGCKSRSGKRMEKLETIPAWNLEKVKSKKVVILETQRDKTESTRPH